MLSANSYSMSCAAAGNMSALSMPCSSINARRRSRSPNASDLLRNSDTNAWRSSSLSPFNGFSRLSSMPGTTPRSGCPSSCGTVPRPVPTLEVSPSIFWSSSFENVTWSLWNFDGLPANSCIRLPSGDLTERMARSIFDGSMYRSKQSSGSLKWLSASLIGYGSVFSGMRHSCTMSRSTARRDTRLAGVSLLSRARAPRLTRTASAFRR